MLCCNVAYLEPSPMKRYFSSGRWAKATFQRATDAFSCVGGVASAHRTCEVRQEQGKDAEARIWTIKAGYGLNIHYRSTHSLAKQQGHTSMPLGNMRLHELSKGMFSLRSIQLPEAGRLPKTAQNANTAENGGKTYHTNPTTKPQHQTHLHRSPLMLSP